MGIFFVRNVRRAGLCAGLAAALVIAAAAIIGKAGGAPPVYSQYNPYKTRSELLMEATREVGAGSPEAAARVWIMGVVSRSAALQYAVMTPSLQDEYARQLEEDRINWVVGVSSPWIESAQIVWIRRAGEDTYACCVSFGMYTSTGPAGTLGAALTIVRDGDFWRISAVAADSRLENYTGYRG